MNVVYRFHISSTFDEQIDGDGAVSYDKPNLTSAYFCPHDSVPS